MKQSSIQTRSEETGLGFHESIAKAFERAYNDHTVHKISFTVNGEDVIFDRNIGYSHQTSWVYRVD